MIVDCAVYRDGVREEADADVSAALKRMRGQGDGAFLWIGLHDPTREEFDRVAEDLALPRHAMRDAVRGHQRPKLDVHGDTFSLVVKTVTYERPTAVTLGEIMMFVGPDYVVTLRHGAANPLKRVRERMEADRTLLAEGPSIILYAVLDEVVDAYDVVSHELESDIIDLERRIFTRRGGDVTEDIYKVKREVLEFRTAEDPLLPVLQELAKGRVRMCAAIQDKFHIVQDHLLRVDGQIDAHNELITSALSAHLALLGKQQNEDVRKISAWAAILALPTLIAGIYGMNFRHMPELGWRAGYPLSIGLMAASCWLLYRWFRRSGWL